VNQKGYGNWELYEGPQTVGVLAVLGFPRFCQWLTDPSPAAPLPPETSRNIANIQRIVKATR